MLRRLLFATIIALVGTGGAAAFDGLQLTIAAARPHAESRGWLFSHSAPPPALAKLGVPPALATRIGVPAITAPDFARAKTGIDLSRAAGLAEMPGKPHGILYVTGRGIAESVAATLDARGFERRRHGSVVIHARGRDGGVDLSKRDPDDPFDGGMGLSQRVAVVNGGMFQVVIVARDDASAKAAIDRLGQDCVICPIAIPLVAMARSVTGDGARVLAASGHTLASDLAGSRAGMRLFEKLGDATDIDKIAESLRAMPDLKSRIEKGLPPFEAAVIVVTAEADASRLVVVARMPTMEHASRGAEVLAARLRSIGGAGAGITVASDARPFGRGGFAIAELRQAGDDGRAALVDYARQIMGAADTMLLAFPD